MFIYEKNKRNSETGKLEQTLNITFEGNKPVENPDVVIDKDGVTGIKSDSNAYVAYYTPNGSVDIGQLSTYISSYSADGEIVNSLPYIPVTFNRYFGFNFVGGNYETPAIITVVFYNTKTGSYEQLEFDQEDIYDGTDVQKFKKGEFIFDAKNLTLQKPDGTISDYKNRLPYGAYGIALGGY